jgi:hypothetical protein
MAGQAGVDCIEVTRRLFDADAAAAGEQQQRWQSEVQLWLLLKVVLLPCASDMLSLIDRQMLPLQDACAVDTLLKLCHNAWCLSTKCLQGFSRPAAGVLTHAEWMQELQGVLKLADQLLYQQPSTIEPAPVATVAAAAPADTQGSSSSSSSSYSIGEARVRVVAAWLRLFIEVLGHLFNSWEKLQCESHSSSCSSSVGEAAAAAQSLIVPSVAARTVELATAFEAAMRIINAGVQSGMISTDDVPIDVDVLGSYMLRSHGQHSTPLWVQYIGISGAAALVQEQRQLYSLLSTVLKMARCRVAGAGAREGHPTAGSCSLAAAQAAVGLLKMNIASTVGLQGSAAATAGQGVQSRPVAAAVGAPAVAPVVAAAAGMAPEAAVGAVAEGLSEVPSSGGAAGATGQQSQFSPVAVAPVAAAATGAAADAAAAAASAQQPDADYLPSLVIVGRCFLQFAEQLQHLAPQLLASCALQQQQQQQQQAEESHTLHELQHEGPALVCIPRLRQGTPDALDDVLNNSIGTLSRWVNGLAAQALADQLVAARCSPQQQQQKQQEQQAVLTQLAVADCAQQQQLQRKQHAALTQLAAAGCAPQQLQQQLDALLTALQDPQQMDAGLAALVQQLQATGRMLCSIAVPHFCNNPACGNLSGPTDVLLVSGRSCLCAGCLTARYCGRDCQRVAWKQHKPVCKALAAAAAAAQ